MANTTGDSLTRSTLPGGAVVLRSPRGALVLQSLPGVLFSASTGTFEEAFAKELTSALDALLARGSQRVLYVGYSRDLEVFTPEAREWSRGWVSRSDTQRLRAVMLLRSRVMRMVVSVLAMLARTDATFFTDEREFDLVVERELPAGARALHLERVLAELGSLRG